MRYAQALLTTIVLAFVITNSLRVGINIYEAYMVSIDLKDSQIIKISHLKKENGCKYLLLCECLVSEMGCRRISRRVDNHFAGSSLGFLCRFLAPLVL